MKNNIDITNKVMKRIVVFEKKRSITRLIEFAILVISLLSTSFLFLSIAVGNIIEQKSLDLLDLFGEDSEIIRQYWKDTLQTLWEELPKKQILIGSVFLVIAILTLYLLRKKISLIIKKLRSIKKIK